MKRSDEVGVVMTALTYLAVAHGFVPSALGRLPCVGRWHSSAFGVTHKAPMTMVELPDKGGEDKSPAGPSPEDWRAFRTALIEHGIQMTQEEDGKKVTGRWGGRGQLKKSVAPANEKLLMAQNPALAKEYLTGVWAHETGDAEVGGLVARMPLDFQMLHIMRRAQHGAMSTTLVEQEWGEKLLKLLSEQAGKGEDADARVTEWSSNFPYMYKLAGRLVKEELEKMIEIAGGSRIDPDRLSDEKQALLMWYVASVESWQVRRDAPCSDSFALVVMHWRDGQPLYQEMLREHVPEMCRQIPLFRR